MPAAEWEVIPPTSEKGPVSVEVEPLGRRAAAAIVAKLFEKEMVKRDKPRVDPSAASLDADLSDEEDFALEFTLHPTDAVYFLLDKVEIRPLSLSGAVTNVAIDITQDGVRRGQLFDVIVNVG
jgi:hypothetical protein